MSKPFVDLASDTKTRPTAGMRRAMGEAEVGDEQAFEDPTVNALCERVADLLGKDAAVFLPSGTMANAIAYRLHCRQGEEILLDRTAHGLHFEAGAPAAVAGAMAAPLDGVRGVFTAAQVEAAIRGEFRHNPRSRLLAVENTSNLGGGTVWPLADVKAVTDAARRHGLACHLDGARLMNAVVASGTPAAAYAACFDTAWIDFSKGLGAPVGACLVGTRAAIEEAWRIKQYLGGAMRQAGILAAAALYALDHHVERLAEDHANAQRLARHLATLPGVSLDPRTVQTNLVFMDTSGTGISAPELSDRMLTHGVRIGPMGPDTLRAVTHLDVDAGGIDRAIAAFESALKGA